jgi:NAD+ diphosphatase
MSYPHIFSANPLDRAEALRRDPERVAGALAAADSRFLLFSNLQVALRGEADLKLAWQPRAAISELLPNCPPAVLLGLADNQAHFALDVSAITDLPDLTNAPDRQPPIYFADCRLAAMSLSLSDTGIVAQARSQLDWHRRHQFCSVCGAATEPARGGYVRQCHQCEAEHFPRTDPVAIMLILDGDHCLLGQSAGRLARTRTFSALAGFIDQGESIEEAVRREVQEEAGISVGQVRYHSSQPWPFPSSLMIGCHGQAESREINMDTEEMTAVEWFHRDQVRAALEIQMSGSGSDSDLELRLPGPIAIAHHLIRAWIEDAISF